CPYCPTRTKPWVIYLLKRAPGYALYDRDFCRHFLHLHGRFMVWQQVGDRAPNRLEHETFWDCCPALKRFFDASDDAAAGFVLELERKKPGTYELPSPYTVIAFNVADSESCEEVEGDYDGIITFALNPDELIARRGLGNDPNDW